MAKNFWKQLNKPILALAPMAGITDSAFREICKKYGADVTYSEMASVSALFFKPKKTLELIRFGKSEQPYVVQLFGNKPEHFAKATRIVTDFLKKNQTVPPASLREQARLRSVAGGLDINFGCPAKKVFGHGSGCALMPQFELAREIISSVCENTDLPVSIKIRAGLRNTTAMEFVENTADLPYSAIMIHARTYEGGFSGSLDFELVSKIKDRFPEKIILANGGIESAEDGVKILQDFPNLDGLGIARGAWGQPWIFNEIKNLFSKRRGQKSLTPTSEGKKYDFSTVKKIMLEHAHLIYADKGETGKFEMRKHLAWYVKGFPGAAELRRKLVMAESLEEIFVILSETSEERVSGVEESASGSQK